MWLGCPVGSVHVLFVPSAKAQHTVADCSSAHILNHLLHHYATAPVDISEHNAQFKASLAAAREWNIYYSKQAEGTDNQ